MKALLDVNVLIALLDSDHIHHSKARDWLGEFGNLGWMSCAVTIAGCARIMANPSYPNKLPVSQVLNRLREATELASHTHCLIEVSLLNSKLFDYAKILSASQVTDIYLLGLATANQARLVTFDSRVSIDAVKLAKPTNLLKL
jgi:uncharacterized protein